MIRIIAMSDLHIGSTRGLLSRAALLDDDGRYLPSERQYWLGTCRDDFLARAKARIAPDDIVVGLVIGDAVDTIPISAQLWTHNITDIVRASVYELTSLRNMCHKFVMIRGTEIHVGRSGYIEELVARELDATRLSKDGNYSHYAMDCLIDGVRFFLAHHGRVGRLPWTRMNVAGVTSARLGAAYRQRGLPPPHVALYGHVHIATDSGENYETRIITLPSFQLDTAHGVRVAPGEELAIGGALINVCNGRATCDFVQYYDTAQGVLEIG
jgi:hypothetical protein